MGYWLNQIGLIDLKKKSKVGTKLDFSSSHFFINKYSGVWNVIAMQPLYLFYLLILCILHYFTLKTNSFL